MRVEAVIGRADEDVVDVEQEAAAGTLDDFGEKLRLADRGFGEGDVGRGVLEKDRALERGLHDLDVLADPVERLFRVGQGQEIVEESARVRRPGEMLGEDRRLIPRGHAREPREMGGVQRSRRADRQADAVQRQRVDRADRLEPAVRRPARAHVVLCMDLEKTELRAHPHDGVEVLGLEADAGA